MMNFIFYVVFFAFGWILVVGTRQRWAWLVNPPNEMWSFYSQAAIKRFFGQRVLIGYTYITGVLFIVVSLAFMLKDL